MHKKKAAIAAAAAAAAPQDASAALPAGMTEEKIEKAVEDVMRTMNWDELSVKSVSATLATQARPHARCPAPRALRSPCPFPRSCCTAS